MAASKEKVLCNFCNVYLDPGDKGKTVDGKTYHAWHIPEKTNHRKPNRTVIVLQPAARVN